MFDKNLYTIIKLIIPELLILINIYNQLVPMVFLIIIIKLLLITEILKIYLLLQ